ncbi:MAG: SanA protein [Patiriisocius sp.]|jgi:SanA protein
MIADSEFNRFNDIKLDTSNDVALVLGASYKTVRGKINPFFYSRMKAVAELYHAKKIKHVLVSGDNGRTDYDESTDMKNYLMTLGISDVDIALDFGGFKTFDSFLRCKEIFGVENVTIISQAFHTPRALFLAKNQVLMPLPLMQIPYRTQKK